MPFLRYLMICLLCLPLTLFAAEQPVSKVELEHAKEVIQLKLDNAQSGLQKDNQAFVGRLDSQDKRIEDIKWRIDIASLFLAGVGILITILAGFASFLGYITVTRKAKEEAQKEAPIAAKATVEQWLAEHHQELESALTDFRSKAQTLLDDIALHANQAKQGITDIKDGVQEAAEREMAAMHIDTSPATSSSSANVETPSALQQVALSLEKTPEAEYKFKEWNARAFAAYQKDDLEGAARYWKQAAESADATAIQIAQSLFNSGIALHRQNRNEEALATYNEVIARFDNDTEPALRVVMAKTMVYKGAAEGKRECHEEALVTFNQAITRFSDAIEPALREYVAHALNGKGFALLCLAKQDWNEESMRKQRLQQAQSLFIQALEHTSNKGVVLGNQAYCAHLLGQAEQVRELLHQALTAGGEELYQATLGDLALHPVQPDAEFSVILDEVWTQVKAGPSQAQ